MSAVEDGVVGQGVNHVANAFFLGERVAVEKIAPADTVIKNQVADENGGGRHFGEQENAMSGRVSRRGKDVDFHPGKREGFAPLQKHLGRRHNERDAEIGGEVFGRIGQFVGIFFPDVDGDVEELLFEDAQSAHMVGMPVGAEEGDRLEVGILHFLQDFSRFQSGVDDDAFGVSFGPDDCSVFFQRQRNDDFQTSSHIFPFVKKSSYLILEKIQAASFRENLPQV